MKFCGTAIAAAVVLSLCLSGCLSLEQPRDKIDYYVLEYDPPGPPAVETIDAVVRLERFSVAPVYNTRSIVYRDRSFSRHTYSYHKWRANPGDLVSACLLRDFQHSGLFAAVLAHGSRAPFDYALEVSVDEFLENDSPDGWQASAALSSTLLDRRGTDPNRRVLMQKTYRASAPCRQRNPRALAEAMSTAVAELSEKIRTDIAERIREYRAGATHEKP